MYLNFKLYIHSMNFVKYFKKFECYNKSKNCFLKKKLSLFDTYFMLF